MIFRAILLFLLCACLVFGEDNLSSSQSSDVIGAQSSPPSVLPSDFFAGALADATAISEEAGKQRLIDVKSATLSPALAFATGYKYKNNPDGNSLLNRNRDGNALDVSLTLTSGLGEYAFLNDIVCAPSLMLMQMRTYNDIAKDFGTQYRGGNANVQIAGISFPFVLPRDFILTFGHTYMRPILMLDDNIVMYTNTPSVSLTKNLQIFNEDQISVNFGYSYTISKGDTEIQGLSKSFGEQLAQTLAGSDGVLDPFNLNDTYSYNLSLSYPKPLSEKLTLTPSASINHSIYTKGTNDGRKDTMYTIGVGSSFKVTDWFSVSTISNFMAKQSNFPSDKSPEFKDFNAGLTLGFNHAF